MTKPKFLKSIVFASVILTYAYTEASLTQGVRTILQANSACPLVHAANPTDIELMRNNIYLANIFANAVFSPLAFIASSAPNTGATAGTRITAEAFIRHINNAGAIPAGIAHGAVAGALPPAGNGAPGAAIAVQIANNFAPLTLQNIVNEVARGIGSPAPGIVPPLAGGLGARNAVDGAIVAAAKLIIASGKAVEAALNNAANAGQPINGLNGTAIRAYNVYRAIIVAYANIDLTSPINLNKVIDARVIVFSFLNLHGNVGDAGKPAIAVAGAALPVPAVVAPAIDQALSLWEHDMERGHLWQIPNRLTSSNKAELHYLAWSRAARIGGEAPSVHTSFVIPSNRIGHESFSAHFENILQHTANVATSARMDVSWNNTINGIAINPAKFNEAVTPVAAPTVAFVVPTNMPAPADRGIVDIHLDVSGEPIAGNVLKTALLTAIGGDSNILPAGNDADTALKTRKIVDDIIKVATKKSPRIWIDSRNTVYGCNGAGEIPEGAFIPLLNGNRIANKANELKPGTITIGIKDAGDITTMFAE